MDRNREHISLDADWQQAMMGFEMRTDCKIDGRKILCKNASHIGYCKWYAKPGDLIVYDEGNGNQRMARVLGRVTAPNLSSEPDAKPIKGWALVMALGNDGSHAFERWVDPDTICEVIDIPSKLAAFFFAPKLPYDVHTMRRLMEHGTVSEQYIDNASERIAMFKARENAA